MWVSRLQNRVWKGKRVQFSGVGLHKQRLEINGLLFTNLLVSAGTGGR